MKIILLVVMVYLIKIIVMRVLSMLLSPKPTGHADLCGCSECGGVAYDDYGNEI